jgi:hypothetical protein
VPVGPVRSAPYSDINNFLTTSGFNSLVGKFVEEELEGSRLT